MVNQEHLDILRQGVEVWNEWRDKHLHEHANPSIINLGHVNLSDADLRGADLSCADFRGTDLIGTDFSSANLDNTDFSFADLTHAKLSRANLRSADLTGADLSYANLTGADLSLTKLNGTNFSLTEFSEADLTHAVTLYTLFGSIDLRTVKGLETVNHLAPSTIGIDTIYRSGSNIPEAFLRGAGVPDTFITYMRSLVNNPIEYYTCFISYSSKDQAFAERLYADLQSKNVRCWYAPEDLKIGDHYHQRIDESIRLYDKLVLILSEYALQSAWVEREVVAAREKEDREKRQVLFPLRLDETVIETTKAWAADIRRRWHIGDFTQWKHHDVYQQKFKRLLHDLQSKNQQDTSMESGKVI